MSNIWHLMSVCPSIAHSPLRNNNDHLSGSVCHVFSIFIYITQYFILPHHIQYHVQYIPSPLVSVVLYTGPEFQLRTGGIEQIQINSRKFSTSHFVRLNAGTLSIYQRASFIMLPSLQSICRLPLSLSISHPARSPPLARFICALWCECGAPEVANVCRLIMLVTSPHIDRLCLECNTV